MIFGLESALVQLNLSVIYVMARDVEHSRGAMLFTVSTCENGNFTYNVQDNGLVCYNAL